MTTGRLRNIAIIGLGWHARRVYYPWLEQEALRGRVRITGVVDLEENREAVQAFLERRPAQPEILVFTTPEGDPEDAADPLASSLAALHTSGALDAVIVSTDPIAHKRYVLWALKRDVHVLLDKPITAPAPSIAPEAVGTVLLKDFDEIAAALERSKSRLVVQAQRRVHPGYAYIKRYLEAFLAEFGVPVSFLDLYHADGMWVMPHEWDRDHHPYKYGTGKLLHSGYHFLDLGSWLLEPNDRLIPEPSTLEFYAQTFGPRDFLALLEGRYDRLFGPGQTPPPTPIDRHGELDLTLLGRVLAGDASGEMDGGETEANATARGGPGGDGTGGSPVRTTISLQLLQSSFSRRASPAPPADPYKGAGRVRHERLNLQVGPLLNLQVHSYQSYEVRDRRLELPYGPGHLDHFDVLAFRNADVVGGVPFEKLEFGRVDPSRGHNEQARIDLLDAFLEGRSSVSDLSSHRRTTRWLARIYQSLYSAPSAGRAFCRMPWNR